MLKRIPRTDASRARQRAYRRRVNAHRVVVLVELDCQVIDWLVDTVHACTEGDSHDRAKLGQAVSRALKVSAAASQ